MMKKLIVTAAVMVVAACSSAPAGEPVAVEITDGAFNLDATSVDPGLITFEIDNAGSQVHEFEVFAGASAGQVLPLVDGIADTTGLTVIDEVEDIVGGTSTELTLDLAPGTYLLICNLPAHYAAGNWSEFTVTG
ncbi:MAG: cupredoxin domain-containing protein [Acidimicrobiia bacterium]|nr:cupredoxin domain-containing protein [Acidimicrobiia bacterium]